MVTFRSLVVLALTGTVACGGSNAQPASDAGEAAPSNLDRTADRRDIEQQAQPADGTPRQAAASNEVDLTFEGAFSARLSGSSATCSLRRSGPIPGATWQVRSDTVGDTPAFQLTIIAEAASFDDPSVVVNVTGAERASYTRRPGRSPAGLTLSEDATSATIDLQLTRVAAAGPPLHVKGTIRCPAPLVSG